MFDFFTDASNEFDGDVRRGVAPLVADVRKDCSDLLVGEFFLGGHGVVVGVAFDLDDALKSFEDEFYEVIIAVPVLGEDPFAASEGWELAWDTEACGLVANGAVLLEDAFADEEGVGWAGIFFGGGGVPEDGGVENVGAEVAAVVSEVKASPKDNDHNDGYEPKGDWLVAVLGVIALAEDGTMDLTNVLHSFLGTRQRRVSWGWTGRLLWHFGRGKFFFERNYFNSGSGASGRG